MADNGALGTGKIRVFVIEKASGRPLPGVVVALNVEIDDGISLTLGLLVSDVAGYVSFDAGMLLGHLAAHPKALHISATGDETATVAASYAPRAGGAAVRPDAPPAEPTAYSCYSYVLKVDARAASRDGTRTNLPSIQRPDACDWELSPGSFSRKQELPIGEGACEQLVPGSVVEREVRFLRVVRVSEDQGGEAGNVSLIVDPATALSAAGVQPIGRGVALEYLQQWTPLGHSLGNIVYSLALAPCESVNIAVIDWSRRDTVERVDAVRATESLFNSQRRDRTIDETIDATLKESQGGWSLLGGSSTALGGGARGTGSASATVPVEGVPVNLAGNAGATASLAQLIGVGGGISNSWGERDLDASSLQELHDKTKQQTSVVRTLSSTVVIQATQEESNTIQTRTVSNHNHCHSLTIQYYEVLRNYKIATSFVRSRPVVLIPFSLISFDWEKALRFRIMLESILLDSGLRHCFEAVSRLHRCPDIYKLPAEKAGESASKPGGSENATSPDERTVDYFKVSVRTTDWNYRTTWGDVWVDVWSKSVSDWRTIWHKTAVRDRGVELNKVAFPQQVSGQELDVNDLGNARVSWQEDNGADSWDFAGLTISYKLRDEAGEHVLVEIDGTAPPSGSKSGKNALRFFDDSGSQPLRGAPLAVKAAPEKPKSTTNDDGEAIPLKYSEEKDACCEKLLIGHLNDNVGHYSRGIWLLRDPVEHRILLDAALKNYPKILYGIDEMPLAVSGNYVAFAYRRPPSDKHEDLNVDVPVQSSIVALPTRGVFAEAQLGHCNACEVRDVTRFWKWDECPCEKPPTIEGITPGPRGQTPNVQPTALPSPVVQISQPLAAPDPVGLAAALNLLGTPNIFRDMSGMSEVSKLLNALASGSVDLAKAQLMAKDAQAALGQRGSGGGGAGQSRAGSSSVNAFEPDAAQQIDRLKAIEDAKNRFALDDNDVASLAKGVLGGNVVPVGAPTIERWTEAPWGIDVSHHQGIIDWSKVQSTGVSFAYIKASDGVSKDKRFQLNWTGAERLDMIRGAYHFWRPQHSGKKQAEAAIGQIGFMSAGNLPIALDVEDDAKSQFGAMTIQDIEANIQEFSEAIFEEFGVYPLIYTGAAFWKAKLGDSNLFSDRLLWISDWNPKGDPALPGGWPTWEFRQLTDSGRVDGITGLVDVNLFNGTLLELWILAGRNPTVGNTVEL